MTRGGIVKAVARILRVPCVIGDQDAEELNEALQTMVLVAEANLFPYPSDHPLHILGETLVGIAAGEVTL